MNRTQSSLRMWLTAWAGRHSALLWTAVAALLAVAALRTLPGPGPAGPAGKPEPGAVNLAKLPRVDGAAMAHTCGACHGTEGRLGNEAFMPLAGMPVAQFVKTMRDFREGKRPATLMAHVARGFTDQDYQAMGEFFAKVSPQSAAGGRP